MPDQTVLIPYRDRHAQEIIRWATSLEEARRWAGPGTGWPLTVSVFQRWHADPDVHPFVLCRGDSLLGYGEIWIDPAEREVELARIIVAPPQRGRGVGREFVRLLLRHAASSGFGDAFVRVFPDNAAAIACYLGAGFFMVSKTEQREFNAGQPVDYVWMQAPIPNS